MEPERLAELVDHAVGADAPAEVRERAALTRTAAAAPEDLQATANSYFGMLGQATASHHDRARLAKVVLARARAVDRGFTRSFA